MCGLAGLMATGAAPDLAAVERMGAVLAHRGPDGEGMHVRDDVAMAHRRLAIIDIAGGAQPLFDANGVALIANGEIYNYIELKRGLSGVDYATASDCEPPLHYYGKLGAGFAAALRGMYAIAIHDPVRAQLVLVRDPFGIKPLYYAQGAFGLAFASEPKALLAAGFAQRAVAPETRNELLQLQFTTGAETIFPDIRRVLPGETLVASHGRIIDRVRRAALPDAAPAEWSEDEAMARLDRALRDSVAVHQRSDVPYGMFLSGGIDSSVLLALMAELNERPVVAYTAGFTGEVHDERAHARTVARRLGATHIEVEVDADDFWRLLPAIAAAVDDPAADYAIVPTFKLAREAAKDLKVVLTGEGGDELFAGYGRYRSVLRPWWRGGRVMRPRGIFDGLGVLRIDTAGWRDGIVEAETAAAVGNRTRLQVAQAVDGIDWLPNDLLIKLDRCLMAHGLEGRTPFLDPAVAEVAFRLPDRLKIWRGKGKYLLRRWLEARVSEAEPFARKRGFTVPVAEWISAAGHKIGPLVARQPAIAEIARAKEVKALFRSSSKRAGLAAWTLLFYAVWHRCHIDGRAPSGDTFDMLSD